jgi:hypothetical protein
VRAADDAAPEAEGRSDDLVRQQRFQESFPSRRIEASGNNKTTRKASELHGLRRRERRGSNPDFKHRGIQIRP